MDTPSQIIGEYGSLNLVPALLMQIKPKSVALKWEGAAPLRPTLQLGKQSLIRDEMI